MNIVKPIGILVVLIWVVGIAAANPCPEYGNAWNKPSDPTIAVFYTVDTSNPFRVNVVTLSGINENTISGIPGIREVCLYIPTDHTQDLPVNDWNPWGLNGKWHGNYVAEFSGTEGGGTDNNMPLDMTPHNTGHAIYSTTPAIGNAEVLVHVEDLKRCGQDHNEEGVPLSNSDGTPKAGSCFIVPAKNTAPVPELSPLILTFAGLFGIVLVSRKYKN